MTWRRRAAELTIPLTLAAAMLAGDGAQNHTATADLATDDQHVRISRYATCLPPGEPLTTIPLERGRAPSAAQTWGETVRAADTYAPQHAHLIERQVWVESRYNPLAVSRVGAAGPSQFMPLTAEALDLRTIEEETLECVLERADQPVSGDYVTDLKRAAAAARTGELPYNVLRTLDERFDPEKALPAQIAHLNDLGLGRVDDPDVFLKYIAGSANVANNTNIGPESRSYYTKILNAPSARYD